VQCSTQLQPAIPCSICKVEGIRRIGKNTTRHEKKKEKQKGNEGVDDDDDGSWDVFVFHALDD